MEEGTKASMFRLSRYIGSGGQRRNHKLKRTRDNMQISTNRGATSSSSLSSTTGTGSVRPRTKATMLDSMDASGVDKSSKVIQTDENNSTKVIGSEGKIAAVATKGGGTSRTVRTGQKRSRKEVLASIRLSGKKRSKPHHGRSNSSSADNSNGDDNELRRLERSFFQDEDVVQRQGQQQEQQQQLQQQKNGIDLHLEASSSEESDDEMAGGLLLLPSSGDKVDRFSTTTNNSERCNPVSTASAAGATDAAVVEGVTTSTTKNSLHDETVSGLSVRRGGEVAKTADQSEDVEKDRNFPETDVDDAVGVFDCSSPSVSRMSEPNAESSYLRPEDKNSDDTCVKNTFDLEREIDFLFIRSDQTTVTIKAFTKILETRIGRKLLKDEKDKVKARLVDLVNKTVLPQIETDKSVSTNPTEEISSDKVETLHGKLRDNPRPKSNATDATQSGCSKNQSTVFVVTKDDLGSGGVTAPTLTTSSNDLTLSSAFSNSEQAILRENRHEDTESMAEKNTTCTKEMNAINGCVDSSVGANSLVGATRHEIHSPNQCVITKPQTEAASPEKETSKTRKETKTSVTNADGDHGDSMKDDLGIEPRRETSEGKESEHDTRGNRKRQRRKKKTCIDDATESRKQAKTDMTKTSKPKRQRKRVNSTTETGEAEDQSDKPLKMKANTTTIDVEEDATKKAPSDPTPVRRPRKARRTIACALCKTCPCQKAAGNHDSATSLNMNTASTFSRSGAAVEKALIRRFQKLEKSAENIAEQKETVRRSLKKHRRDIWKRKEKEASADGSQHYSNGAIVPIGAVGRDSSISTLDNDAWFLPDAEIFEQQQSEAMKRHPTLVERAQLATYNNAPLKQPSLLQMGFSRGNVQESDEPIDIDILDGNPDSHEHCSNQDGSEEVCEDSVLNAIEIWNGSAEADDEEYDEKYVRDEEQNDRINRCYWGRSGCLEGNEDSTGYDVTWIKDAMIHKDWPHKKGRSNALPSFLTNFDKMFQEADRDFGSKLCVEDGVYDDDELAENEQTDLYEPFNEERNRVPNDLSVVHLSMLSQGAQDSVKNMWSSIGNDTERLARLKETAPDWKENIVYSFHQKDPDAIDAALKMIQQKRERMNTMKKLLLEAWERQDTALEVFDEALRSSAGRVQAKGTTN